MSRKQELLPKVGVLQSPGVGHRPGHMSRYDGLRWAFVSKTYARAQSVLRMA
jgi:hypothetical protein